MDCNGADAKGNQLSSSMAWHGVAWHELGSEAKAAQSQEYKYLAAVEANSKQKIKLIAN